MTRREYTVRTIEFAVAIQPPWTDLPDALSDAITAARHEYREHHHVPALVGETDRDLEVTCRDGEIVVRFEVEEPQR